MEKLTKRQQQILDFIRQTAVDKGYPPTRAEICAQFGFRSPNAAEDHLKALARKGALELQSGVSRGIQLPKEPSSLPAGLPLVGRVAAGSPILAIENVEQHHVVDPTLFRPRADYLLRVHGTSMRDAGINDGDLLAVHRTPEAEQRQVVVARIDDEVTVKRFERRGDQIILIAENPDFPDITVDLHSTTLQIEGIAVGVIRPECR